MKKQSRQYGGFGACVQSEEEEEGEEEREEEEVVFGFNDTHSQRRHGS